MNLNAYFIAITIIHYTLIKFSKCELLFKDDPKFVFYSKEILKIYPQKPQTKTINYSSKQFKSEPIIILGLLKHDNQRDPNKIVDFNLISEDVNKEDCKVKVNYDEDNTILFGIEVSILAIDISQFPQIFFKNDELLQFDQKSKLQDENLVYEQDFQFSPTLQKFQGKKNAAVFLRGYKQDVYKQNNKNIYVSIKIVNLSNTGYKVKISSNKMAIKVLDVYFSVLEYVEDTNSIYGLFIQQDIVSENKKFEDLVQVDIELQNNIADITPPSSSYKYFFASFNQIYFDTKENVRISLVEFSLSSSNKLSYSHKTWDRSISYGSTSTALFFYEKQCKNQSEKILGDKCEVRNDCNQDPMYPQLCLQCKTGEYLNLSTRVCSTEQPQRTYCEQKGDYKICKNCDITDCDKCTKQQGIQCTQCQTDTFLFDNQCLKQKPEKSYCDEQNKCSKCDNQNCKTCKSTLQECDSCFDKEYLFNSDCQKQEPDGYYCENFICQKCTDSNCKTCSNPKELPQKCLTCKQEEYLLNGKCYQKDKLPEEKIYCDKNTFKCQDCSNPQCKTCNDPIVNSDCLECNQQDYLYNKKCYEENKQPDHVYCDPKTRKCLLCKEDLCIQCEELQGSNICLACKEEYYLFENKCQQTKPENSYCDNFKCKKCQNSLCKSCESDLQSCSSCLDQSFKLNGKTCKCIQDGYFIEQNQCKPCLSPCQECEKAANQCTTCVKNANLDLNSKTCLCKTNHVFDKNNNCIECSKNQKVELINGVATCQCKDSTFYFNEIINDCVQCSLPYCKKCSKDGKTCDLCKDGFIYKDKTKSSCKYCGSGLYSQNSINCSENCKKDCILCSNANTCEKYTDDHIFVNDECHYSCSKCRVPHMQYDCIECSSDTRQFLELTGSCQCKSGYTETGKANCSKQLATESSVKLQSISQIFVKALYLLYLPQLFINIHPFGDTFIYEMQQIGNFYFVNQHNSTQHYKQFTIFNFFNIYYESEIIDESISIENTFGIKYKTIIDKDVSNNLIIVCAVLIFLMIVSLVVIFLRSSLNGSFFFKNLLWNSQMKLIRISSNYFLVNIFLNITNLLEMKYISFFALSSLLAIYLLNLVICFKKTNSVDENNFRYLYSNLNLKQIFHRKFWLIYELKKFLLTCCLSFITIRTYPYLIITLSFVFSILLAKFKPYQYCIRDCFYLIINELFMIVLSVFPLVIQQLSENIEGQGQMINFLNITIIIHTLFQFIITGEYVVRLLLKYKHERKLDKIRSNSQQPMVMDATMFYNIDNLSEFLNQTSPFRNSFIKKKKNFSISTKNTNFTQI